MNPQAAYEFLRNHVHISEDVDQTTIDTLNKAYQVAARSREDRFALVVMESFGDHMGWGMFQVCNDVLSCLSRSSVISAINKCLQSDHPGHRWWASHWSVEYADAALKDSLLQHIASERDEDSHTFALDALVTIHQETEDALIALALKQYKESCSDDLVQEILENY